MKRPLPFFGRTIKINKIRIINISAIIILFTLMMTVCGCGCGSGEDESSEPSMGDNSVSFISKAEAVMYFHEITTTYRYELMTKSLDDVKAYVGPALWKGVAPQLGEYSCDSIPVEFINDEERNAISEAYGNSVSYRTFGVYETAALQRGIDDLYGQGTIDVKAWDAENLNIVNTGIFYTSAGYTIGCVSSDDQLDSEIYGVISSKGGEGEATIVAYALRVDNISDHVVYDLSKPTADGEGIITYPRVEGANIEGFGCNDNFETNVKNMSIDKNGLGKVTFTFGVNGISMYLKALEQK